MKTLRRQKGLSQTALAQAVGKHMNTIHRIELGRVMPDLALAGLIAEALGADVEAVFPEVLKKSAA